MLLKLFSTEALTENSGVIIKKTTDGILLPPVVFSRIVLYDKRISIIKLHIVVIFFHKHIIKQIFRNVK